MIIHPAKLEWNYNAIIREIDQPFSVKDLPVGMFRAYTDEYACPSETILCIDQKHVDILRMRFINKVCKPVPTAINLIEAIVNHADKHPSSSGEYCFVCTGY